MNPKPKTRGVTSALWKDGARRRWTQILWSTIAPFPGTILWTSASAAAKRTRQVLLLRSVLLLGATIPGFLSKGLSIEEGELLLKKLAVEARDSYWEAVKASPQLNHYNRALVAACIKSYGAYLADGSEYSGDYEQNVDLEKLKDLHCRRSQVLVEAGSELLAFESIPSKLEAQILQAGAELLEEENIQIPSWIWSLSINILLLFWPYEE